MIFFGKKYKIITHSGGFHADDVFACAALSILLRDKVKIIRTRDPKIIGSGDYVVDVGGVYDPARNRFDHHQKGGAGMRKNGIQYASIGLVWKEHGARISGSLNIANDIDRILIQSIDAPDNGQEIFRLTADDTFQYQMADLISSFAPTWNEKSDNTSAFLKAVSFARNILLNEIKRVKASYDARAIINKAHAGEADKRLVVVEEPVGRFEINLAGVELPELLFGIFRGDKDDSWKVAGMRKSMATFEYRKKFPPSWGGLSGPDLSKVTGVPDALFCHRDLFLTAAKSKEGAMRLANLALEA